MSFLVYLLKVTIASGILFGYYRLFLCNKKFHHYNRFFLIGALVLSIALPFIRIPVLYEPENPLHKAVYHTVSVINTDYEPAEPASFSEALFTVMNAIYLLYAIGAVILLTLISRSLIYIHSIRKKYHAENITSLKFYNTQEPGTPFSFFRSIFWNDQLKFDSREGQQIFRHELFHVQHHHSVDRLLAELVTAVFWFNPFFHLIKRELRAIHEFLADQFAINGSDRYTYATLLVQQALEVGKHRVTNHFFQNHIKRRIAMITQFKQSDYGYWSRVMVLPVSVLLFCFITLYAEKPAAAQTAAQTSPYTVADNSAGALPDMNAGSTESNTHFITPPDGASVTAQDTIPDRERKLREERELRIMEMKLKMAEREAEIKKVQQARLSELKQKMQAQEQMQHKVMENQQLHEKRMLEMEKELKDREIVMEKAHEARLEEMKLMMRKMELDKADSPQAKKLREAKLSELKQRMQDMQHELQEGRKEQHNLLKHRMMELEHMHDQQAEAVRKQREEMMTMKRRMQERETELRKHREEELRNQREELKKMERQDTIPAKPPRTSRVPAKRKGEVIRYRVTKEKPAKPGEEVVVYRVTKSKPGAKPVIYKTGKPPVKVRVEKPRTKDNEKPPVIEKEIPSIKKTEKENSKPGNR